MHNTNNDPKQLPLYACDGPPEHGLPAVRQLRALIDRWEAHQVAAARARGYVDGW